MTAEPRPGPPTTRRRPRRVVRPSVEALEGRAVPAGSLAASFDGLTTAVIDVTLPQPTPRGGQLVTLSLPASPLIPTLFRDNATGKHLGKVAITLGGFGGATAPVTLSDAVIASFQTVNPTASVPTYVITVAGTSTPAGSITASFDGRPAPVVNVTLTQPPSGGAIEVGLTLVTSPLTPTLSRDAATGKALHRVQITFVRDGNHSKDTVTLADVVVGSFRFTGGTRAVPTYAVTLIGHAAAPA